MASGDTLLVFTALHYEPPSQDYATLDTRNQHPVLDFDSTTNESALFSGVMPRHYAGNGLTVYLHYAMSSATSGSVDWDVAFERISDQQQDIDVDGFAAAKSVDGTTVPGTSGLVDVASIDFNGGSEIDNIVCGEGFRFKVMRDAVNDTATSDAELLFVEIKEK